MAGLGKPQCGIGAWPECPLRAVLVGQFEIAWLDRGDTTNGSYEPEVTDATYRINGRFLMLARGSDRVHHCHHDFFRRVVRGQNGAV
jgi:hypothetical protein